MPQTTLPHSLDSQSASLENRNRTATRIVDVHSLHKSGTMFLFHFFRHLANWRSFQLQSPNNTPPQEHGPVTREMLDDVSSSILCRAPIRTFDVQCVEVEAGIDQRRIFHLRDPRDILVSEYYSFGWIHPAHREDMAERRRQIQEMSIDDYVIRQPEESRLPVDKKYAVLEDYQFDDSRETVVKYEQMVTQFPQWCYRVLVGAGFRNPTWMTARLAWKYRNEFKTQGESLTHKRRITPGDFRDKLKPATIEILNERFEKTLTRFDYPF